MEKPKEKPKVFIVKVPQTSTGQAKLPPSATETFEPFGPDETQAIPSDLTIFEAPSNRQQHQGNVTSEESTARVEQHSADAESESGRSLSRLIPSLPRRKKPSIRDDIELHQSLQNAVAEGKTSKALRLANKRRNHQFAESGDLLVANALHRLPYSRRVERYLRKMEKTVAPSYLSDLTGTYTNKNPKRKDPEYAPQPQTVAATEQIVVGTGNTDMTEVRDNTQYGGAVINFPGPERRRPSVSRKVLVAAASVAALLGSMNMFRGGGEEEAPQSALPSTPAPSIAPPATLPPIPETSPVVIEAPAETAETELVSHVETPPPPTISTTIAAPVAEVQPPVSEVQPSQPSIIEPPEETVPTPPSTELPPPVEEEPPVDEEEPPEEEEPAPEEPPEEEPPEPPDTTLPPVDTGTELST